jgi:hypothetical protein
MNARARWKGLPLFAPTAAFAATGCSYVPNQSSKIGFACVTSPTHAYVRDSKADGKGVRDHLFFLAPVADARIKQLPLFMRDHLHFSRRLSIFIRASTREEG